MSELAKYGFTPEQLAKLSKAIAAAVLDSRATHPQFIRADPKDHGISPAETQRRADWCVGHIIWAREHMRWTVERITDRIGADLAAYLDGVDPEANENQGKRWMAEGDL